MYNNNMKIVSHYFKPHSAKPILYQRRIPSISQNEEIVMIQRQGFAIFTCLDNMD